MIAILSRIFTEPNLTVFTVLGMFIMVLGGLVCIYAVKIKSKLTGREQDENSSLGVKLLGLAIVIAGLIITVYLKG